MRREPDVPAHRTDFEPLGGEIPPPLPQECCKCPGDLEFADSCLGESAEATDIGVFSEVDRGTSELFNEVR